MPRLGTGSLDGNLSSSSDSDNENEIRRAGSAGSSNVVDAIEVIPASPPPASAPRRVQSQPFPQFRRRMSASASVPTGTRSVTEGTSYEYGSNGSTASLLSQLNQLRSLTTASSLPLPAADNLDRQQSDVSHPDLAPPSPLRDTPSGDNSVSVGRQTSTNRTFRRPSTCGSVQEVSLPTSRQRSQTPLPHDDDDGSSHYHSSGMREEGTEYHDELDTQFLNRNINGIPSDWDLHQLEMAEMGRLEGSATTLSLARQSSAFRRHSSAADPPWEDPTITYDDRLPASWVAPVGVLVAGAVVLGLVLFAL